MIRSIESPTFLEHATRYPVIDVRSPGEYSQGHVPGAVNIPLFSDEERAIVGTLYVQSGREEAILKGLDLALPKMDSYLKCLRNVVSAGGGILLHCWRGGLRSNLMAEVFSNAGYEVVLLAGGYKAYRRFIREELSRNARIVVLGGFTGTGKTALLHAIASLGQQVIDLEGLACHKGSVFGALGQPAQPTNEQFENNLHVRWSELDLSRLVWMEDESRMIGRITLPDPVVEHILTAELIKVEVNDQIRIMRLVKEYSIFEKQLLADAIQRISERLGGTRTQEAISALETNRFEDVARITLSYYDKAYLHSLMRRERDHVHQLLLSGEDVLKDASDLIEFANNHL
jgi:tRNA 2-selenouridine synthase